MLEFLKSEDSLNVYSNGHELLAVANMFKINIHIFTYEGKVGRWTEVGPDPAFPSPPDIVANWAPEMFLYHSNNNHYDLLVKDDSRLAKVALVGGAKDEISQDGSEEWKTVKKQKLRKDTSEEEKLLADIEQKDVDSSIDELSKEFTLFNNKKSGHMRTAPQASAENKPGSEASFKCNICAKEVESQGILNAHMKNHTRLKFKCETCDLGFAKSLDLEIHKIDEHEAKQKLEEWNCNDCFFQSEAAPELMKHLKVSGHQPSPNIRDKRKVYQDYKQCYTCQLELDGYWNLMSHRKNVHPSNKKCRNFPGGKCSFGNGC